MQKFVALFEKSRGKDRKFEDGICMHKKLQKCEKAKKSKGSARKWEESEVVLEIKWVK